MLKRATPAIALCLFLAAPGFPTDREQTLLRGKRDQVEIKLRTPVGFGGFKASGMLDKDPYKVHLGVYGMYEPIAFPDETWVWLACFSQPGETYTGLFGLVWVDLIVEHAEGAWDSRDAEDDLARGLCSVDQGVDATFIQIPRGLDVREWTPIIDASEQVFSNVRVERVTVSAPHIFNRPLEAVSE